MRPGGAAGTHEAGFRDRLTLPIIFSLLLVGGYGDVALRDLGLLLGALTLARLASAYPSRHGAPHSDR